MVNFKSLKYKIRKNTSFDFNSKFQMDLDSINLETLRVDCIGKCGCKKYNLSCSLFEFDWIDNKKNIVNSNIPYSPHLKVKKFGVVHDELFDEFYDYFNNKKIEF